MNARMGLHVALSMRLDAIEAHRLTNEYRAEVLAEASAVAKAMPTEDCSDADSYDDAWDRGSYAVGERLQEMADQAIREKTTPQGATATPHTETFDGELAMLRGLVRVLRTVARQDDLREVKRLLTEHASDENAARAGAKRARMWPADWDDFLDAAIRDEDGEWTTNRVQHLYKARYEVGLFRGDARMCLSQRAHQGLLKLHDRPHGRVYTRTDRKDGRP